MHSKNQVPQGMRESTPVERTLDLAAMPSSMKQELNAIYCSDCQTARFFLSALCFAVALIFCFAACESNDAKDWACMAAWTVSGVFWLCFGLAS